MNTGQFEIGEGCRGVVTTPPGGRMIAASDQLFKPALVGNAGIVAWSGRMGTRRKKPTLTKRYGAPPFTVLDARQGYWQERKRLWKAIGLQSHKGRRTDMATMINFTPGTSPDFAKKAAACGKITTSVFDPTLCELIYRWFCPPDGLVLDPFAGGSVRGVIAALLGRRYMGIDLSKEQVKANRQQWAEIKPDKNAGPAPKWVVGDSRKVATKCKGLAADFIFSCPPYHNLEKYSDDPRDLSNMHYVDFIRAYRQIITDSLALLKDDRFACFVVGDIRDAKGYYRNFVGHTVDAFLRAGAKLYNDAILLTAAGTLALRAEKPFTVARKLGKGHQNVLVFIKGNPRRATDALGPVEDELPLGETDE